MTENSEVVINQDFELYTNYNQGDSYKQFNIIEV